MLILLSASLALWQGLYLTKDIYTFFSQSKVAKTAHLKLSVIEKNKQFFLQASYDFSYEGKQLKQKEVLKELVFDSRYLAEKTLESYQKKNWNVYFDPHNPKNCSLQKVISRVVGWHFLLCASVCIYFVWLRQYLLNRYKVQKI